LGGGGEGVALRAPVAGVVLNVHRVSERALPARR
jgi:hypothetical protein